MSLIKTKKNKSKGKPNINEQLDQIIKLLKIINEKLPNKQINLLETGDY